MKKLPIGIDSFSEIRTDNYCYVDKTALIHKLVTQGKNYFLSRPRRFGKSLLIDTIAEAFHGRKELFRNLYLETNWNWRKKHPVIRIDFAQGIMTSQQQLENNIMDILHVNAELTDISLQRTEVHLAFAELIRTLHQKTGQRVVVLVDEYDKPILDNLIEPETAQILRDCLRGFYSVLKAQGSHLKFVMLTGVSKFSKVSLFSGLNNLEDITLDPQYGTLCGYTHHEFKTVFRDHIKKLDLNKIRQWYDGYHFLSEPVYNPFDVLLYLKKKVFMPYWFETGTPTFLINLLHEKHFPANAIDGLTLSHNFLNSFDVDNINPQPLLFQTGYLTIKGTKELPAGTYYTLGFPNLEVRSAFNDALLMALTRSDAENKTKLELFNVLASKDLAGIKRLFHSFFASIPHDWYRKNDLAGYEGYYCSIVYCYFTALGLDVRAEESTNHGQLDMAVLFNDTVFIFEFKVNELTTPSRALDQIKERKYHEKYTGREIYLIGIEFSKQDRNITRFEWEKR